MSVHVVRGNTHSDMLAGRASAADAPESRIQQADASAVEKLEARREWRKSMALLNTPGLNPALIVPAVVQAARSYERYLASHPLGEYGPVTVAGWWQMRADVEQMLIPRTDLLATRSYEALHKIHDAMTLLETSDPNARAPGTADLLPPGKIRLVALKHSQLRELGAALAVLGFGNAAQAVLGELGKMSEDFTAAMTLFSQYKLEQMHEKQFLRIRIACERAQMSQAPVASIDAEERARSDAQLRSKREMFLEAARAPQLAVDETIEAAGALSRYKDLAKCIEAPVDAQVERAAIGLQAQVARLWESGALTLQSMEHWKLALLGSIASGAALAAIELEIAQLAAHYLCAKRLMKESGLRAMSGPQLQAALAACNRKYDVKAIRRIKQEMRVRDCLLTLATSFEMATHAVSFDLDDVPGMLRAVSTAAERFAAYCEHAKEFDFPLIEIVEKTRNELASKIEAVLASKSLNYAQLGPLKRDCLLIGANELVRRICEEGARIDQDFEEGLASIEGVALMDIDQRQLERLETVFAMRGDAPVLRGVQYELQRRRAREFTQS